MPPDDPFKVLHTAVNCYLSALQLIADSMAVACPPVGGPYRQRLGRLRTRLAFDANADAIEESRSIVEEQLKQYSQKASQYVERHGVELRRAVSGLQDIIQTLAQRQDFYVCRLRQFATQMETTAYPKDPENLAEVVALQASGLSSCVESMGHESQSLMERMRDEMLQVDRRLAELELTDPVTGLMNRREMERRIEERKAAGEIPTLLLFDLVSQCPENDLPDEVAQQVAARLGSQFRHNDLVCRWTVGEFLVMFQGLPETARGRAEQIFPWIAGRYLLDDGGTLEVAVEARVVDPEIVVPEKPLALTEC